MANVCSGSIRMVSNKKENIENFAKLFYNINDKTDKEPDKYFARSSLHEEALPYEEEPGLYMTDHLTVEFAWSAYSCLIDGYPQKWDQCLTIMEACKEYNVGVTIQTDEPGMAFVEYIAINNKGDILQNESIEYVSEYNVFEPEEKEETA